MNLNKVANLVKLPENLADWLDYIQVLHTKPISMGLDRVSQVAQALKLIPKFPIITVAGTNGKGSTCAMLSSIYRQAGYKVGSYTSPHLLRYNERVRIGCQEVADEDLCAAFFVVETARSNIALTYFEIGTLAAMWHFMRSNLDVVILEVGLGGRLDAVNIFEPTCAIVTSVDFDHQEFLGNSRELIGYEKAGIYRRDKPAICGDDSPPSSLLKFAEQVGANLWRVHHEFDYKKTHAGWDFFAKNDIVISLPMPALVGDFQLSNAACVVATVKRLHSILPVSDTAISIGLKTVALSGRFQIIAKQPSVILDVAHNPHAAASLADNLRKTQCNGQTLAVFAMLADKDIKGVIHALKSEISAWYIAEIDHARGAKAEDLIAHIKNEILNPTLKSFVNPVLAYKQACIDATENDRIVVFGSFFTVADVLADAERLDDIVTR